MTISSMNFRQNGNKHKYHYAQRQLALTTFIMHHSKHNDTQNSDTQHIDTQQNDIQRSEICHNDTQNKWRSA
jgi:hypothetical protein